MKKRILDDDKSATLRRCRTFGRFLFPHKGIHRMKSLYGGDSVAISMTGQN